ncbi:MAG: hypothetical protein AUJ92_03560 [Armatimonadetes bacterium CG2_30_59_28]|nr:MAG: hypothetical protein AUJ92_03560 [Armatimonadetes bacterium CG2_30_59_28]PIU62615.1 MAG: VapC toxin family PIN domain ribonuclease [Armatimonadetes bacterium CG07_land_8_20_14_0_80_59_28]
MGPVVADTHAISWYILEPGILSTKALVAFTEAENAGFPIYLPSISIVEICYLIEKGRLTETVLERILSAVDDPEAAVVITPLDSAVALAVRDIPSASVRKFFPIRRRIASASGSSHN